MNSIIINNDKEYGLTDFTLETYYGRTDGMVKTMHLAFGEVTAENSNWDQYYNVPITSITIKEDNNIIYTINDANYYIDSSSIVLEGGKLISKAHLAVQTLISNE